MLEDLNVKCREGLLKQEIDYDILSVPCAERFPPLPASNTRRRAIESVMHLGLTTPVFTRPRETREEE